MGLFNRLFGQREPAKQQATKRVDVEFSDGFVYIHSLGFYGQFSRSPDGRFALAWLDGDGHGTSGFRSSGPGRYLLLLDGNVIVDGRIERPNDGRVANNGSFIINDWRFGDGLKGTFAAFDYCGRQIISRDFKANLYNNGFDENGAFAVCQTCNADCEDGSVLAVFDLAQSREVAVFTPEAGWAERYEFDPAGSWVRLHYHDGTSCTYDMAGRFLDKDQWIERKLAQGDVFVIEALMREHDGTPPPALQASMLVALDRAVAHSGTDAYRTARAHKVRGQLFELTGDLEKALGAYDAALALDPKVGVKRKADQIRKKLATPK